MADNRGNKRKPGRAFSIGFLSALVEDELLHCEDVLAARGWNKIVPGRKDHEDAGIVSWEKNIFGNTVNAFSTAINKMGQTASALETFVFLTRCNPADIFLVGIAGSLQDWVFRRDVVVAKSINWQTQNGISGDGPCDEYRIFPHDLPSYDYESAMLLSRWMGKNYPISNRLTEDDSGLNVYHGSIFTWDYVVNSQRVVERILKIVPEALCVEMEGGGFLSAIARYAKLKGHKKLQGFIVRGISDYAKEKTWDPKIREDASRNAMEVAIEIAEWRAGRYFSAIQA